MEVVVLVPAPALRRAVRGREGAVVVVAVVAGRVRVEVTGRGRLVVVGRVRVDVVGRVWVAVVVMGAVVMVGGGAVVVGNRQCLAPIGHDPPVETIRSPCPSCC